MDYYLIQGLSKGTISLWFKPESFSSNDNVAILFDKTKVGVSNYLRISIVTDSAQGGYSGHDREIEVRIGDNVFYSDETLVANN